MVKVYSSFVVRCWVLKDQPLGERRILDVEHVQSGERLRTTNFADVCAWMESAESPAESDCHSASDRAATVTRGPG
jgi:hypothetical protein